MNTARRALLGTFSVAVGSYVSLFIYFVTGVILARLLNPADFGVFRIALFFADLFGRVREFGLDKALIHKQDGLSEAYRAHFTFQSLLAVLSLSMALIFSPLIISHYSKSVFLFILIINISYFFQSLGSTQRVVLEKNLLFHRTAVVDIFSLVSSSAVSILLALKGFGVLSLVVGYALNFIISSAIFWWIRPWEINFRNLFLIDRKQFLWFFRFGIFLFLGGLTTFVLYKYNDFILGTFLSVTALGLYSRAFNYAQIPTSLITSVISKVALPTYSALQDDRDNLAEAFTIVLKTIVRLSFPFSLVLYLVASDFTLFLLGAKWLPMVPVFRILLLYGVLRSIFDDLGELFTSIGKTKIISFYLLIQALISLALAPVLTGLYKAEGAALSLSIVLFIGVLIGYFFLSRQIKIKTAAVFLPTVIACFLTFLFYNYSLSIVNFRSGNVFYSLVFKGFVFSFFYLIFIFIVDGRSLGRDVRFIRTHLSVKKELLKTPLEPSTL